MKTSVALAGSTDHLPYSIHYGHVCKAVTNLVESSKFRTLEHLAEEVSKLALGEELHGEWVQVIVEKPRTLLRADGAGISIVRRKDGGREAEDRVFVKSLRVVTIIGVNSWERKEGQTVVLNLTLHKPLGAGTRRVEEGLAFDPHYDYRRVAQVVTEHVEKSIYKTVEALATAVARVACIFCEIEKVTVSVEKPSALTFAKGAGVEITRHRAFFDLKEGTSMQVGKQIEDESSIDSGVIPKVSHRVFVALGSNMGDRFEWIKRAVKELDSRGLKVQKTSSLYESKPMYVLDQPEFLNGVCEVCVVFHREYRFYGADAVQIETTLSPINLLKELKDIEDTMGRKKIFEKGPRNIDLDILLYDGLVMETEILTIPHKLMLEREFVLRPLCEYARLISTIHTYQTNISRKHCTNSRSPPHINIFPCSSAISSTFNYRTSSATPYICPTCSIHTSSRSSGLKTSNTADGRVKSNSRLILRWWKAFYRLRLHHINCSVIY